MSSTNKRRKVNLADTTAAKVENDETTELKHKIPIACASIPLNTTTFTPRIPFDFYNDDCVSLSKKLLGKILVRRVDNTNAHVKCRIVEVEAYTGVEDPASHSYKNKITERNKAMFMQAGTLYVYNIYGIYCCINVISNSLGGGVLIRAVEPLNCFDYLKANRANVKLKDLTNGPSKLCLALNINKQKFNQIDLCANNSIWLEHDVDDNGNDNTTSMDIVASKRINIDYAGDDACNKLLRFYIKNNIFVSKIDKTKK